MVPLLAQRLAVLCLFLHALLGRVDGNRSFSWGLTNHESEQVRSLTVCDNMHISLAPLSGYSAIGQAPYTLLAFEAGGISMATQVGEDGLWQVKHRIGSRLLLVLLDSLGNSGGILPTVFTVGSGSSDCLPMISPAAVIPTVTTNATHLEPCDSWHLSIMGGVPPYTIILASPGAPILQHFTFTAPQGSTTFSLINNAIKLRGSVIAAVRDSSGVFGQTTDFVESIDGNGMSCKVRSSHEWTGKFNLVARSSGGMKLSHQDTIIVAVCVSVGGIMILAALCFAVVMKFRRRKRGLIAGQDARPRPFDVTIPALSTDTSPPQVNVSVPLSVIDISTRNNWMASPTDASPVSPSRTHVRQLPIQAVSRQPSDTSLRSPEDPRSRPPRKPSNSSMHVAQSPQALHSSRPPRQQQSNSSMRSANNNHPTNIPLPAQRSIPTQEGRMFRPQSRFERHERILHPSRSTGDIHDDNTAPQQQHRTIPRSPTDVRNLNQLRHYYSASNIRHRNHRAGQGEAVYQHRDGGDPPPPYHKFGAPGK